MQSSRVVLGGVACAAAGAGILYFLDPVSGRRRRARIGQKAQHAGKVVARSTGKGWRDAVNRTAGSYYRVRSRFGREQVDDGTLLERVRARIGHACSHPGALSIDVQDGVVTLRGPILAAEDEMVFHELLKVRGIRGIDDQLELHDAPGHISSLQGGGAERTRNLVRSAWSPAWRLGAEVAALGLLGTGLWRRGLAGLALNGIGGALLLRSVTNRRIGRVLGRQGGNEPFEVNTSIDIEAPVTVVFDYVRHLENVPHFTRYVREVVRVGDDRWHWLVVPPGGRSFRWEVVLTSFEENALISWGSTYGADVENAGSIRFHDNGRGGTKLAVQFIYSPSKGRLASLYTRLMGGDVTELVKADLRKLKEIVEDRAEGGTGRFNVDAQQFVPPSPS